MLDSFIFVSHASKDKPLLRPLIDALIDADLKVWVDNPADLNYTPAEIDRWFYRLHAHGRWRDELDEAKRKSACILVCWSQRLEGKEALKEHPVLFGEADYGRTEGKLVCCRIDGIDTQKLPNGFEEEQAPDIRNPSQLQLLIDDVQRKMGQSSLGSISRRRRLPLMPWLANRSDQENKFIEAFEATHNSGGVRPFFVCGPENECVDEFMKRLEEHTTQRDRPGEVGWEVVSVDWPVGDAPSQFPDTFQRRLGYGLKRRDLRSSEQLAAELTRRGRRVAVISRLRTMDWNAEDAGRLKAWLDVWKAIAAEPGFRRVFPVLALKMPRAEPGWKEVPGGIWFDPIGKRNRAIWKMVKALAAEYAALNFTQPDVLAPIQRRHADDWLNDYFSLGDPHYGNAKNEIKSRYGTAKCDRHGVAHEDFAAAVTPFCTDIG